LPWTTSKPPRWSSGSTGTVCGEVLRAFLASSASVFSFFARIGPGATSTPCRLASASAKRRPSAAALMIDAGPRTKSPPANRPGSVVSKLASTFSVPLRLRSTLWPSSIPSTVSWPIAAMSVEQGRVSCSPVGSG